ncbi:MAG TPA: DUF4194 domain-containing protein [Polyangia bacterium]
MSMTAHENQLSPVLITLLRGVVYRENDAPLWQALLDLQARVRDHLALLGLDLVLDETEGCASLRQRAAAEGEPELPRLVPRRQLSYPVSLLLVLLRKRLVELDATGAEGRLILSRGDLVEMVRVFLPDSANEARFVDRMETHINKVVELGFLRRLRGPDDQFEIRRILKAFVDAQWLNEFDGRLAAYRRHAAGVDADGAGGEREVS